jgi:hypothetical protein
MPLNLRSSKKNRSFDLPVSYRINESRERLRDALNVFSNQGRLETRFGRSLYNSTLLSGSVLSISFFKKADGTRYLLAKVDDTIYSVSSSGAHTAIKTGLSAATKHRGVTWNRGSTSRHIISCESDGLFQFDGITFTQLGQDAPGAVTAVGSATTGSLTGFNYKVYATYYSSTTGFESNASTATVVSIAASKAIQDLTYKARMASAQGNLISITYTAGATAGAEVVTVAGDAITVQIASGSTTAYQIKSAIESNSASNSKVSVSVSGTGTGTQIAQALTLLANGNQSISVTGLPSSAANATIDKVRLYLRNTDNADVALFVTEFAIGTTSFTITTDPTSTLTFPLTNAAPLSGGGKFLTEFNRKLVYAGNGTYKNDVFFSEEDYPDAFNDGTGDNRIVLNVAGDGDVTGLATGLYNNTVLDPYLVVFKKRSTHIYSEIGGDQKFTPISYQIGCVSHDSIRVKNGDIYFLSDQGWRTISNGRLVVDQQGDPITLGMGDIDDIFKQPGMVYEINRSQASNCFSVYYSTLDQYITWIAEGSNTNFYKAYCYEFNSGGFKPYQFNSSITAACTGEDSVGAEVVFMADTDGAIYTHSIKEDRNDDDSTGTNQAIDAFAMLTWLDGDDMDSSYNFRELFLRRVVGTGNLTVKSWVNFTLSNPSALSYSFIDPSSGFVLDVDKLDEGVFGDERTIVTSRADINRAGENLLIGFYQSMIDGNINLVSAQMDFNKNGNRN